MKWMKHVVHMKERRKMHTEFILGDNLGVWDVGRKILLK